MKIPSFVLSTLTPLLLITHLPRLTFAAPGDSPSPRPRTVEERLEAIEARLQQLENRVNLAQPDSSAKGDAGAAVLPATEPLAARFEVLDQKVRILERLRELEQQDPAAKAVATPSVAAGADGFMLRSNNGDYRLAFGLVAQTDGRFSLDAPKQITNTFTLRKIRPTFSGRIGKYFDFKVMPDFGNGTTIIQDAYFDIRFSPAFRLRSGKDKTPIGYEMLQVDAFLLFPERALASSLVPNRDIGLQAQGDLVGGKLFYAGGVFNGIPDGTSTSSELDTNGSKDLAGRVVLQPFKSDGISEGVLNGLGFQVGGSTGRQIGALPSFKTSVGQTYFSYDTAATASGPRRRLSPAVFYYYKGFGAFGEYMRSTQAVTRAGARTNVTNRAWEVTGSILLTGETASDRGVRPIHDFAPANRHWGALQLLGRYTVLTVDRDAFTLGLAAGNASRQAKSFTVGLNWYPIAFIKFYGTFERTVFDGNASRPPENVILIRTQLGF